MTDDWKPADYKPRGGWRAMLPSGPALLALLVSIAAIAGLWIFEQGTDGNWTFTAAKVLAVVIALACVAPQRLRGNPFKDDTFEFHVDAPPPALAPRHDSESR